MSRKSNYPESGLVEWSDNDKIGVRQISAGLLKLYESPRPITNAEVKQRIDDYFRACLSDGGRPGIEGMCLALGISRTTLFNWAHGRACDRERQEIVLKAKQYITAFLEAACMAGKINPVSSIFLLRNWCGYSNEVSFDDIAEAQEKPIVAYEPPAEIIRRRQQQPPKLPKFEE